MREVANRLEHMGWINRDLQLAVAIAGPMSERILELRGDFSYECSQLLNDLTALLACPQKAQLASRIVGEFVSMHQFVGQHQQFWSHSAIAAQPEAYIATARNIGAAVINFIEGSLEAINADLSRPETTSAFAPEAEVRLTGTR